MVLKRRRQQKTDYKQRLGLLKSKKHRLVVRRSLNNIHIQVIKYEPAGDKTIIEVSSKNLRKYGWKAHGGNLSSAYLCGLLSGLMTLKKEINDAVLDIGLQTSKKGSVLYAAAMGARDAGLSINIGDNILPDMNRVSGRHVSNYAKVLKSQKEKYNRQFSQYAKSGLDPEKLPEHFEEVKNKILNEFGFKIQDFKKVDKREETKNIAGKKEEEEAEEDEFEGVEESDEEKKSENNEEAEETGESDDRKEWEDAE